MERVTERFHGRLVVASGYVAGERPTAAGWRVAEHLETEGWAADLLEPVQA